MGMSMLSKSPCIKYCHIGIIILNLFYYYVPFMCAYGMQLWPTTREIRVQDV